MRRKPDLREPEKDKIIQFLGSGPCRTHVREAGLTKLDRSPIRIVENLQKVNEKPLVAGPTQSMPEQAVANNIVDLRASVISQKSSRFSLNPL